MEIFGVLHGKTIGKIPTPLMNDAGNEKKSAELLHTQSVTLKRRCFVKSRRRVTDFLSEWHT